MRFWRFFPGEGIFQFKSENRHPACNHMPARRPVVSSPSLSSSTPASGWPRNLSTTWFTASTTFEEAPLNFSFSAILGLFVQRPVETENAKIKIFSGLCYSLGTNQSFTLSARRG